MEFGLESECMFPFLSFFFFEKEKDFLTMSPLNPTYINGGVPERHCSMYFNIALLRVYYTTETPCFGSATPGT